MSETRDEYIRALFELSKADASKWATFIAAFTGFAVYEFERSMTAPSSEAQVSLGMNRRMRELRDDFIHIEALAAKLKK